MNKFKKILPYVFVFMLCASMGFQFYHYTKFMTKGPRFTAYDGQHLCERYKIVEDIESQYEPKLKDLPPLDCDYASKIK